MTSLFDHDDLNLKTHTHGYCVSTVRLRTEHDWGPLGTGGYWYETYVFPSDGAKITDWLEVWGTRYRTEEDAKRGHEEVVARVERREIPEGIEDET